MKKVFIFGTFPSPLGGTSIHVYRLFNLLKSIYDVKGIDTYGTANKPHEGIESVTNYKKFLLKFFLTYSFDLIHSHTHSWNERLILCVLTKLRFKKIIFTFHSLREDLDEMSIFNRAKIKLVSILGDVFVVPNLVIKKKLIEFGVYNEKIVIIPTLILPDDKMKNKLDPRVDGFLTDNDILISCNASNNNLYKGDDLYGLDIYIDLCEKFKANEKIKFLYCVTKITDKFRFENQMNRVKDLNLENKLFILNDEIDFIPVLKRSSVFIRPTCYDSYGISVGEAIHLKIPAIASDVCTRTQGAILFKNRDLDDLYLKLSNVLEDPCFYKEKLNQVSLTDNSSDMLKLYNKVL
ncbi:glycosyltransferase [Vibrio jasicida]|uniref:Glycosyltransferase n=1 Tax=Vibrio jasicida TaxID=766224 RepID=A0ABW7JAI8_9VIBR